MERTSSRTLQIRPARLAAAALTFVTAALLLLVAAGAAHATVWVIPATDRAFPGTQPTTRQAAAPAIKLDAAQNEYEGAQVVLSGVRDVTFSWSADSDPLITQNTVLDQVYYVNVTQPTSNLHAGAGEYPDPLVPRSFGASLSVPDETTSFYLLAHVPNTPSAAGDHAATLIVQSGQDAPMAIPFTLHVWSFGWTQLSTRTGFALNMKALQMSLSGANEKRVWMTMTERRKLLLNTYRMLSQHGISSVAPVELPEVSASGHFNATQYAANISPYLDAGGLDMSATRIPWVRWFPWRFGSAYDASSARLSTYLTELCAMYKEHGWQDKAYAYIMDETTKSYEERAAERYARVLHAAARKAGTHIKFLLTDDPRPRSLGGVKQANGFLNDDVDIWGVRYFYFFGRVPALRQQKAAGKEVWWYTYANGQVAQIPNYVIEKPNTDQRVWGWLMQKWNVDGLMNWGLNEWFQPKSPSQYRDPYQDTLSYWRVAKANGDCSLIYPGYYPRYGLDDPYAAPVSSLRLEALRDGLEDREYLILAQKLGGGALVASEMRTITTGPDKTPQANVFNFPKYSNVPTDYGNARTAVANFIEAHQ